MNIKSKDKGSRKILLLSSYMVFLLLFILSVNGCSEDENPTGSTGTPGTNEIFMQNTTFTPANRTVPVGTTIKWINKDNETHTVTSGVPGSPSGMFDSGNLGLNGEFTFTFTQAGTFSFFCTPHPNMTGTITVQ